MTYRKTNQHIRLQSLRRTGLQKPLKILTVIGRTCHENAI